MPVVMLMKCVVVVDECIAVLLFVGLSVRILSVLCLVLCGVCCVICVNRWHVCTSGCDVTYVVCSSGSRRRGKTTWQGTERGLAGSSRRTHM
jgi:hypothetical protein